jgi:hypothetical protein
MSLRDSSSGTQRVFGFTWDEWVRARAFELPDAEAERDVTTMFAQHEALGSDGFVFDHRDMLLLSYVSPDCRSRILAQLDPSNWFSAQLREKLRLMDRETRAGGRLRRPPSAEPL